MSKKLKAVESNIQPNHKEAELWVTPTNNDGSKEVKYWNSKAQEWSECSSGDSGGSGEDSWIYYDVRGIDNETLTAVLGFGDMYPLMLHTKSTSYNGETVHLIKGLVRYQADRENVLYVALDIKWKAYYSAIEGTLLEFIEEQGLTELFSSIPRITKEEFYSLT